MEFNRMIPELTVSDIDNLPKKRSADVKLTYRHPTDTDKYQICSWHYEGEYAVYDWPSYEEMRENQTFLCNPEREKNYHVFLEGDTIVGFVNIVEKAQEIFIGIGVAPQLCGMGYGREILLEAYRISKEKYPEKPLYLEVRTWNQRAVRCYQKAGFTIDGEPFQRETHMGAGTFYRMVKP